MSKHDVVTDVEMLTAYRKKYASEGHEQFIRSRIGIERLAEYAAENNPDYCVMLRRSIAFMLQVEGEHDPV